MSGNKFPTVQWEWLREFKELNPRNAFQVRRWYKKSFKFDLADLYVTLHYTSWRLGPICQDKMRLVNDTLKKKCRMARKHTFTDRMIRFMDDQPEFKMYLLFRRHQKPSYKWNEL